MGFSVFAIFQQKKPNIISKKAKNHLTLVDIRLEQVLYLAYSITRMLKLSVDTTDYSDYCCQLLPYQEFPVPIQ